MTKKIVLIVHNIRSTHNVGAILRIGDALGVNKIFFTGYTPYPKSRSDNRLPHLSDKINGQIAKTALGAEKSVNWQYSEDVFAAINRLKSEQYTVAGLEQNPGSIRLPDYTAPEKIALILGEEVHGINQEIIKICDELIEIPQFGTKESLNVSVACGIAVYALKF